MEVSAVVMKSIVCQSTTDYLFESLDEDDVQEG